MEQRLARRARSGDAEAFGELVARYRTSALRVATVVLGSGDGADDVVQEATERTWRAHATLDPDRGARAWYLRAVANCARNDRRARGRRAALAVRAAGRREPVGADPGELVVDDEDRRQVVAALNSLGADDRLVIALRHIEQLSEADMAQVLELPPGTVKSRLSRAMGRLRQSLADAEAAHG